jgi:putative colanic acid biosynthesis UDP-glucose lipid carrier transferase
MFFKGIENHSYTNRLIKWVVIMIDFAVLWLLLPFVVDFIKHSEEWNDDKYRTFWMVCTLSMIVSEYWFSSEIYQRLVGTGDMLRRVTMLVATQTVLSYLLLRAIRLMYRMGWQMFFLGIALWVIIILLRFAERWLLQRFRKMGYNMRKVTFIGSDPEIHRLYQTIISNPTYGYKLRSSYVSTTDFASQLNHPENLRLGDEVYLCVARRELELIERTASLCHHKMIKFYYVPLAEEKLNLQSVQIGDMEVMTTYNGPLEEPLNRLIKRVADILLSLLFLIPTVLLLPLIAIIIKRQSPGPVFFRQRRTGLNGRDFYCYKFRSMHVNTDADRLQATKDDPRKFPFGDFIRKTNIDELPQFWNVLVGDMSIVGPRPHMLAHTEQYEKLIDKYMVRHFVKPGITGWAQVTGFRGETRELCQMEGRVERDIWYIQHWSLWLDLRIIWMTIKLFFQKDEKAY